jgi:2'-5' RNA ligase
VRLFIAINLPSDLRQRLWEAAGPLRAAGFPVRWVAPEGVHLTLKFLGEVKPDREVQVVSGIGAAVQGARRFTLPVGGFGAFPLLSSPRVVWAGCEPVPALELLQHRVEQEMEPLGFPLEGRAFHPHLTLGRAQRDARASAFREFEDRITSLAFAGEVSVESVDLMESQLGRDGARYTRRHAASLAA